MKRRSFLKLSSITAASLAAPVSLHAATPSPAKIVVIGGGFAGSTVAKYLKMWGGASVDVTIIEEDNGYTSPILSNLVLNGYLPIEKLRFTHTYLQQNYKVNVVRGRAIRFDTEAKTLTLEGGTSYSYDKLVLAPGIDFKYVNDYDIAKVPHAWIAGEQTTILKNLIETIKDGDTFVMSIPKSPYRCPPGPYERACVVADYLKNKKRFKNVKVIVLDENPDIIVEKDTFGSRFAMYGVDYRPSARVTAVDDAAMSITYEKDGISQTLSAKVLNVIPNQKAAKPIFDAGVNEGDFAPVDLRSYESLIKKDVYIIGDSHKSTQPKAGHIANSEAKICADAILRSLNNRPLYAYPKTNSACYSPVSSTEASWLTIVYKYDAANNKMVPAAATGYPAAGAPSRKNFEDMFYWAGNLFADTFK